MSNTVPEGWVSGLLSDFSEVNPKLNQRVTLKPNTPVSFIRMEDVSNEAVVRNVRVEEYQKVAKGFTAFQNSDVLVAKITPCFENGKGGYVDNLQNGVGFGSTEFHVLRSRPNGDSRYLYQFSTSHEFRLSGEANMTGSAGQRRVPTDYLKTLNVVFPPLPEQQKIAAILSSVDDVIEKTRAQIDKLKDLKTGMMQELLTKGIGPDGAPHTAFKDSPLGRIPEGWGVRPLMEFSKPEKNSFVNGPFGSDLLSSELTSAGVPVIYVRDLKDHKYERVSTVCVTELKADSLPACLVEKNDVLVAKVGDPPCGSGVYEFDNRSIVTQDVIRIRPNHDVDPYYLSYLLNSPLGRKQIEKIEIAGTRTRVSLTDFKKLLMPYPSSDEQRYIGQALRSVDLKIWSLERKKLAVTGSKKALMQDLLTGKVRVKVD